MNNSKFNNFINEKMMPFFLKFSTQRHLVTIRDSFGIINPLIIAGALSLIGSIFLFGGSGGVSTSILGWVAYAFDGVKIEGNTWTFIGAWQDVSNFGANMFGLVTNVTIGLFSLYLAFEVAYIFTVANKPKTDGIIAGLVGLGSFAIFSHAFSDGNAMFMGASGILIALISGFLSATIFSFFSQLKALKIKMPKEVPPAISLGLSYIFPVLLTLLTMGLIDSFAWLIGDLTNWDVTKESYNKKTGITTTQVIIDNGKYGLSGLFYRVVGAPFEAFAASSGGGLGIAVFYSFFIAFFWWFGINGSSVMNGFFAPILIPLILKNTALVNELGGYDVAEASGQLSTVSITFLENYTQLTGWGMTGGLIVTTFIFSKFKQKREIAKLSTVPAIFNVNEPMTFGYPVMLNPVFAIPSMLIMPLNTIFAFLAIDTFGWVNKTYLMVPWTVPVGVGAFLGTGFDWRAIILALFCLCVSVVLYIPFVLFENRVLRYSLQKQEEIGKTETLEVVSKKISSKKAKKK